MHEELEEGESKNAWSHVVVLESLLVRELLLDLPALFSLTFLAPFPNVF